MRTPLLVALAFVLLAGAARAQDQTTEDKLRDALRHATVDLRALQDTQAQLQAERDSATKQRDQLQLQLTEANAKLAQQAQTPVAPAAAPVDPDALKKLQDMLDAAHQDIRALVASNAKWQAAYQQAAAIAQARDAEAKRLAQALAAAQKENQLSRTTNEKLAGLAGDILHLYRSQDFRGILLRSYEPLLGLGKVKLDNTVQDYEDRIADLRLLETAQRP